jgi:hypothetical protein
MSPYSDVPKSKWAEKTKELVSAHPLKQEEIVEVVLQAWDAIFESRIGPHRFRIGTHLFPKAANHGVLLARIGAT